MANPREFNGLIEFDSSIPIPCFIPAEHISFFSATTCHHYQPCQR